MGVQKEIDNRRCCIIAGGTLEDYSFLKQNILDTDYIICADSGLRHAQNAGIVPHTVIGDFDSYKGALPQECEVIRLPVHKDDTDLLAAAKLAVQKGFKHLSFFASLGSRPDQSFAALQNLAELMQNGVYAELLGSNYKALVLNGGSVTLKAGADTYLSVFPLGGAVSGVTLTGVEYPLQNFTLPAYSSMGVSNHIIGECATVSVENGALLIWLVNEI